jgi:transcriptional regulator with XRE-family HTH domain
MDEQEFTAFCEDVEQRGILMPVTMYEGKVLDGWHRYRAGHRTGTRWEEITYKGKDPAGYIASINVLRRKLGSLQRALVGARLHTIHNLTQRDVCRKLGISNEVVNLVLKAMVSKNAKLIKRIETDSDFTRGMLREELEDAGLMRVKVDNTPLGANSVFALGGTPADTNGSDEDEEYEELKVGDDKLVPVVGKKAAHSERRPKDTQVQKLSESFKALMADEKETFLRMIWPEANSIALEIGLITPTKNGKHTPEPTLEDTPLKALKRASKKVSKEVAELL